MGGRIEKGNFNDTNLDGLDWAMLLSWPGPVPRGRRHAGRPSSTNVRTRFSERRCARSFTASRPPPERQFFFVYNSTMSTVLEDAVRTHRTVHRCRSGRTGRHDD